MLEDKDRLSLYSQYNGCWLPRDRDSPKIISHIIGVTIH